MHLTHQFLLNFHFFLKNMYTVQVKMHIAIELLIMKELLLKKHVPIKIARILIKVFLKVWVCM